MSYLIITKEWVNQIRGKYEFYFVINSIEHPHEN